MASLAKYIFNQYLDASGAVLNAGTITAYATGTVNLKDIYTTATGDVAAANPLTLDSDGSANFYLDGSYDLLLKNSAGDTLKTINVVSSEDGAAQAVVNTLADLRALASGAYTVVDMLGSVSAGDGLNGAFYWNSTSTTADDGINVVQPSSSPATGRWQRLHGPWKRVGTTVSLVNPDDTDTIDLGGVEITTNSDQQLVFTLASCPSALNVLNSAGRNVLKMQDATTMEISNSTDTKGLTIFGDLTVGNAYQAGDPTTTGYITVKDSTGTSYKIPVEAA